MTTQIKIALAFLTFVALTFAGFSGCLWYYDQSNSYMRLEGKDETTQLIEYKPSLFELRSTIESEGLSRDDAILKLLTESLRSHPAKYSACKIENVVGNINSQILARVRCGSET